MCENVVCDKGLSQNNSFNMPTTIQWSLSMNIKYSESRLMLSLVNVIIRLSWSQIKIQFIKAYYLYITFCLAQSDHCIFPRQLNTVYVVTSPKR